MQLISQTTLFIIISRQKFSVCFTEDVSVMCNLSLGIEERAEARGENKKSEKVVMNMYKKGYTTEQIMDIVELGEEEIKDIIKANLQLSNKKSYQS